MAIARVRAAAITESERFEKYLILDAKNCILKIKGADNFSWKTSWFLGEVRTTYRRSAYANDNVASALRNIIMENIQIIHFLKAPAYN